MLRDLPAWRISGFRLAMIFVALFAASILVMLGIIWWQSSAYVDKRINLIIHTRAERLMRMPPQKLPAALDEAMEIDTRKINLFGLYHADGGYVAGNVAQLPTALPVDGQLYDFPGYQPLPHIEEFSSKPEARVMAMRLPQGDILLLGRETGDLNDIRDIFLRSLLTGGAITLALGLSIGFILSRESLKRVAEVGRTSAQIMLGDLSHRVAVSTRHDELDLLAMTINRMLDEIERLIAEVKGVTDSIAHDMRTPLTHLRLKLQAAQQRFDPSDDASAIFEDLLAEVDTLLGRFRALLRISEIRGSVRRAGFVKTDVAQVIRDVIELIGPLAEEKGITLLPALHPVPPILGDPALLFEAVLNLLDNAIKFTGSGGRVYVATSEANGHVLIDVVDNGCGIDPADRERLLQPFTQGKRNSPSETTAASGHGLGLSIVNAIVRLHDFELVFCDADVGAHLRISAPADYA